MCRNGSNGKATSLVCRGTRFGVQIPMHSKKTLLKDVQIVPQCVFGLSVHIFYILSVPFSILYRSAVLSLHSPADIDQLGPVRYVEVFFSQKI